MGVLREAAAYLVSSYPDRTDLSPVRLHWLIYLADWRSAIVRRHQLTEATWRLGPTVPVSSELATLLKADGWFRVTTLGRFFRKGPAHVELTQDASWESLSSDDLEILRFVLDTVGKLQGDITRLVYSTYPVFTAREPSGPSLDLVGLAESYEKQGPHLAAH